MLKVIELIVVLTLLVFSFFAGVKYSSSVKNHASWLFETKEEEVELPDLSNENGNEGGIILEEGGANPEAQMPQDSTMDNLNTNNNQQIPASPAN